MTAIPPPSGDPRGVLQVQVTNLDYSDYLGRIAIARVFQGTLRRGDLVGIAKLDGSIQTTRITKLFTFLRTRPRRNRSGFGAATSLPSRAWRAFRSAKLSPTRSARRRCEPLLIDEPTLAMIFTVNQLAAGRAAKANG